MKPRLTENPQEDCVCLLEGVALREKMYAECVCVSYAWTCVCISMCACACVHTHVHLHVRVHTC